jgi:hypothetical protein
LLGKYAACNNYFNGQKLKEKMKRMEIWRFDIIMTILYEELYEKIYEEMKTERAIEEKKKRKT